MGSKSSPPPTPDYVGAANATAAGNADAARIGARANRVDQYAPQGSRTYQDLGNDRWAEYTNLNPQEQALYNQDVKTRGALAGVADKGIGYVQDTLNRPFDQGALPAQTVNPGETAQAAILRRIQPNLDRDREALRTQLLNQGLTEGSEAYKTGLERADQQANDAYSQAALQGISVGQQARQQGIQEQNFFRNEPLNMLNAVRTGSQVQSPTFGMVPQQQTTAGPDILGATQAGYQADLGNVNARNAASANTLGGIAGAGATAAQIFF